MTSVLGWLSVYVFVWGIAKFGYPYYFVFMIVPAMNPDELAWELKSDYDKIFSSTLLRLGAEYDKERRRLKIDKQRSYTKLYTIKTARKNPWIIVLGKAPSKEKYEDSCSLTVCCVTYCYDKMGLKVYRWHYKGVTECFNGHLFTRYNERMQLGLSNPIDIVKHFFKRNRYVETEVFVKNGRCFNIGYCKDGLLLGELYLESTTVTWETYISRDLIRPDQDESEKEIIADLQREIIKSAKDPFKLVKPHDDKLDKLIAIDPEFDAD